MASNHTPHCLIPFLQSLLYVRDCVIGIEGDNSFMLPLDKTEHVENYGGRLGQGQRKKGYNKQMADFMGCWQAIRKVVIVMAHRDSPHDIWDFDIIVRDSISFYTCFPVY